MDFLPFTRPDIDEATIAAVGEVLRSGWITTGPKSRQLEAELSAHVGGRPVRVVASATAALEMALQVAGVGPGDEVITCPLSWVATANVILKVGAKPVFVDADRASRNIDLNLAEAAITPRTRAIIPVDLAGLPVDRDRLYDIAKRHRLRVIEDAAQSMGANWRGRRIGSFGDLVSFSFHANKNMTSGEGGCLVLNDEDEARLFEKLRLQGVTRHADGGMDVDVLGGKANMTDIAAAIGLGQLPRLEGFNARRRELAALYFRHFDRQLGCELPLEDMAQSNWHMFQPLLPLDRMSMDRGEFIARMKDLGIGVGVHYPAMHLFTLFREMGFQPGDFPVAEDIGRRTVTLPLFPAMADEDVERVCAAVSGVLKPVLSV
ncbi:DegT/DnrJ/EryC1/StrS family aminotransferase [Chromobacterium haemolyticum]|uniref:Aminotransferase DegT n=1 Tax=Chromobacterium haemolyticum TaxID=394935 RepID=A0A1W0D9M2_9NEIS|nr:DegT/DnrJ/EryC1/StrS aminotransferase family protein [Chromobacterium haemolyticum]MBK0415571.1 DegT/DnrJ/EryC1/StrS aminotransferase family protein [Chromobacterium haemolyticum]MBO0415009.1 DegT/DnrJ/EryC1/StrS aminotransferase family protein [Chromobacterium haemolyticum]MBO0498270.1 DegT/DnrJ/EryC1/StrS aminotransferase family protein [Chromobacterium haemolyticum]OQS43707.1 aminotransferase DegT [Chromobacterium haemolyticum]